MPWPDDDLLARAAWWCAASGRPAAEEELRAALEPLSWDQLLAVKAVLADPPPPGFEGAAGLLRLARAGPAPVRPAADAAPSPSPPAAPGGDALHLPERDIQGLAHSLQRVRRQPAEMIVDILQHHDQAGLFQRVPREDFVGRGDDGVPGILFSAVVV